MIKNRVKRLKWLLDFIGVNLENLKISEYRKLASEILHYSSSGEMDSLRKMSSGEIERYLDAIFDFTDSSAFTPEGTKKLFGADLLTIQGELKKKIMPIIDSIEAGPKHTGLLYEKLDLIGHGVNVRVLNSKFSLTETYKGSTIDILFFDFIRCLQGLTLSSFRKCPECRKMFVHVTKKEKTYCSNRCAARYGKRRQREDREWREKENREGARRARKSYERRIKESHPNVKIESRPYKYKDPVKA